MSSPASALSVILQNNPGFHVLDYGDRETFSALWLNGLSSRILKIGEVTLNWDDPITRLIIVGSEPPDLVFGDPLPALHGINFKGHFSAVSWLAAWKIGFRPKPQSSDE